MKKFSTQEMWKEIFFSMWRTVFIDCCVQDMKEFIFQWHLNSTKTMFSIYLIYNFWHCSKMIDLLAFLSLEITQNSFYPWQANQKYISSSQSLWYFLLFARLMNFESFFILLFKFFFFFLENKSNEWILVGTCLLLLFPFINLLNKNKTWSNQAIVNRNHKI